MKESEARYKHGWVTVNGVGNVIADARDTNDASNDAEADVPAE